MAKQINLDDEFSLESDGKQWTLRYSAKREVAGKNGEMKEVTSSDEWYCGATSTILKIYTEKSLKKSGAESLKELTDKIDALFAKIDELWGSGEVKHIPVPKKIIIFDQAPIADSISDWRSKQETHQKFMKGKTFDDSREETTEDVQDVLGDMF